MNKPARDLTGHIETFRQEVATLTVRLNELETKTRSMYRTLVWLRNEWPNSVHGPSVPMFEPDIPFDRPVGEWQDEVYHGEGA